MRKIHMYITNRVYQYNEMSARRLFTSPESHAISLSSWDWCESNFLVTKCREVNTQTIKSQLHYRWITQ